MVRAHRGAALLSVAALVLAAAAVAASGLWQRPLPERVVRVHVRAHSDRPEDQRVKELVRLALAAYLADLQPQLAAARDAAEAAAVLSRHRRELERLAREVLRRAGAPYDVEVAVDRGWFGARRYGALTLPAGRYRALVVRLGDGAGRNWWCVAFPSTCLDPELARALRDAPPEVRDALRAVGRDARPPQVRLALLDWLRFRWRSWSLWLAAAGAR